MYEAYWNLNRKPFTYRVNSERLYRSRTLQAAALRMRYCFDNNAGAAMLVGASGVGKSSLLQMLRDDAEVSAPFVHVTFPTLSADELLRIVASDLLQNSCDSQLSADALLPQIRNYLRKQSDEGHHSIIAFDESHLLRNESMNQVVLPLLNLADADPAIQLSILLSGQPVLASHVARNAQLRERIAVTATIDAFTQNETADYIHSRMQEAGAKRQVFSDDSIDAIITLSGGNPRRINRLCDMALLVGFADQKDCISSNDVESLAIEILPAAA